MRNTAIKSKEDLSMAIFITRQKKMDDSYRKVEAMYRKGLSTDEIAKAVNLDRMDVLDIEQKIYHLDVRARKFN
jgi:hypothetical protein